MLVFSTFLEVKMRMIKYYQPPHQTPFSRSGKIITFPAILLIKLIFIQLDIRAKR